MVQPKGWSIIADVFFVQVFQSVRTFAKLLDIRIES